MRLLHWLGYTKPIPMHDHTDSRQTLRAIEHERTDSPFADPKYVRFVERATTEHERATLSDRLYRMRQRASA